MSANTSPVHYYNELEDAFITDANINFDINRKMQVPNKISYTHNDPSLYSPPNEANWLPPESINMKVPERILVAGQNQHIGTRAPPREMELDKSILPPEPPQPMVRVATPPRTLTLDKYPFPHVDDAIEEPKKEEIPVVKPRSKFNLNDSRDIRESTPPIGQGSEGLSTSEEVLHLRKQMAKMNRRVMALELENLNRLQKEKILYGLGIAYFLLKTILWLGRQ